MGIIAITRDWGVTPSIIRITTTDTLAEVRVNGYLNAQAANIEVINHGAFEYSEGDNALVSASDGSGLFEVSADFSSLVPDTGGGPPGPYLTQAANGADASNTFAFISNIGGGTGQILTLTNSSFTGGVYQMLAPGPRLVQLVGITVPGNELRFPIANVQAASYAPGEGFLIESHSSTVDISVADRTGFQYAIITGDQALQVTALTNATSTGTWSVQSYVYAVNLNTGSVTVDLQNAYDFSFPPQIDLANGENFGFSGTGAGFYLPAMTQAEFKAIPLPPTGLMAYNEEDDRIIINKAIPSAPVYDEVAYVSDITSIVIDAVFAEASFQGNATPTTIVTMGVPVKVNGTYVAGNLFGFSQSAGVFTFTTAETREVVVEASLNATMNLVTANVTFEVFHNGSAVPKSAISVDLDGVTPSLRAVSVSCLLNITLNDTIAFFVKNNTGTDSILVQDLNFNVAAIGGTGPSSTIPTWEQTYTAGDGTVTMTTGKPIDVQSADNSIVPTIQTTQTQVPVNNQIIGLRNFIANGVTYGSEKVLSLHVGTDSLNVRSGLSGSSLVVIDSYDGATNTNNYISNLTQGQNTQGVITAVATVSLPVVTYPNTVGDYLVWQTIVGTPQITANCFNVGDTIEIDVCGNIQMTPGTFVLQSSWFEINIPGLFDIVSNDVNLSTPFSAPYNGVFQFKIKITRQSTTLNVSGSGFYSDIGNVIKAIVFPGGPVTPYSPSTTYPIIVNWHKGGTGSSGFTYNYITYGLNIKQYT